MGVPLISAISLLCLLLLLTACRRREGHRNPVATMTQSWDSSAIKKLSVQGVSGKITISPSRGNSIRMKVRAQGSRRQEKRPIPSDLVNVKIDEGTLFISEKSFQQKLRLMPWRKALPLGRIDYHFDVPPSLQLVLANTNGSIRVSGIDGPADLRSVNGAIYYKTKSAPLIAFTVNGKIQAEFSSNFPGARLRTVNGRVGVTVPRQSHVAFKITQVNGGFESNIPVEINDGALSSAEGEPGLQMAPLEISTVNGDITVTRRDG